MLQKILNDELEKRGISMRTAAKQAGVSHSTFSRVLNGFNADFSTLELLCNWLGVPVSDVLDDLQGKSSLSQKIAIMVAKEPRLGELFSEIVDEINADNMDESDLADIVNYASYRLNLKKVGNAGNDN